MGFVPDEICAKRKHGNKEKLQIYPPDYANKVPKAVQDSCRNSFANLNWEGKLVLTTDILPVDLAKISAFAYQDCEFQSGAIQLKLPAATEELRVKEEDYKLEGYTPICYAKKGSYYGCALIKAETKESPCQVIIAHRGTKEINDWVANLEGVCMSRFTSQLNSACTFSLEVVKLVLGAIPHGGSPIQIFLTGHSLGAWLAQISTLAVRYVEICRDKTGNRCFRRRKDKLNPRCIVFDSPGAYPMLRKLYEMDNVRDSNTSSLRLDITNYVISPNLVNCIHSHFGDTFRIPTDKIQKFSASSKSSKTGLHINYTKETHDKMLFVRELAKISNGNGKSIARVTNWPRVTFGCCPAEVEPPSFFVETVWSTAYAGWNKFGEYKKWLKTKKDNFNPEAEIVVDKHCYTLNEVEIEVMEQIKQICLYEKFCKPDSLYDADENKMLGFVIRNFADCNWSSSDIYFKFKNKDSLQALRNCLLFSISFEQVLEKISTNVVPLFAENEKNRKYLEEHYLELKFMSYKEIEDMWNKLKGQAHLVVLDKCKVKLELFLLKIISFCSQNSKRTLILRYDEMRVLNITGDRYGDAFSDIDLVLVDCINSETDITVNARIKEGCKHIWLIIEGNVASNLDEVMRLDSLDLELDRASMENLMNNTVNLLEEPTPLQDFVGPDNSNKFAKFLTKSPKDMLALVMRNPQIKIGKSPPTRFDFENNYFEVGGRFPTPGDAIRYVNKKPMLLGTACDSNDVGYVIVICTNSTIPNQIWEKLNCNNNVQIVKNDINSFQRFRGICKMNPNSFVDLLYYTGGCFELRSQYNPDFYIPRNIYEPELDLRLWCQWFKSEESFKIRIDNEIVDTRRARIPAKIEPAKNQIDSGDPVFKSSTIGHRVTGSLHPKTICSRSRAIVDVLIRRVENGVVVYTKNLDSDTKEEFSISKSRSSDDKVFNSTDIIILSDEPGMGKSTTIVELSNTVTALNVGCKPWVIFIELKHLQNIPEISLEATDDLCTAEIVDCISGYFNYSEMEKMLLRCSVNRKDSKGIDVFFVFDGFDEMDNNSQKRFMTVLKWLNLKTNVRICISTRDHDKYKLEVGLCVMAHQFEPLGEDQYVSFLVKCWIGFAKQWEKELETFATVIIKQLRKYLDKKHAEFFGVPLQLKMISEIFSADIFNAIVANKADNLSLPASEAMLAEGYTITKLYEDFIQRKYKIYLCNKLNIKPETYFESSKTGFTIRSEMVLVLLAAETLAGDQALLSDCFKKIITLQYGTLGLTCGEDELDGAYAVGIVHQSKRELGGTGKGSKQIPDFPHRTFAEFCLAKLLFMCIKSVCFGMGPQLFDLNSYKVNLVDVFRSYVFPPEGFVVRTFLNDMIASDEKMVSSMKAFTEYNDNLRCLTDTPENRSFRFDKNVLSSILEQNHTFLLAFVLSCFHISESEGYKEEHQIEPVLIGLFVLSIHFFIDNYTFLKPLFIILHCIKKHYKGKLEDVKFVSAEVKEPSRFGLKNFKPIAISSIKKRVLDNTSTDPFAILLLSENSCFDFGKCLEELAETWGNKPSVDFRWPRFSKGTKAEVVASKILKEVKKINSTIVDLEKFKEDYKDWFRWFERTEFL